MPDFKSYRGKNGLNLQFEFDGLGTALAGLNSLPIAMGQQFKMALRSWADDVLQRSKSLVPVNTGLLRSTGQVFGPEFKDGSWEVHIGYGDKRSAWYAAIVHERLNVRHPRGQAKYLEQPINENLRAVDAALSLAIDASLEKVA